MGLVRTNITLPEETLALVDAVAGPRGRSRYIADLVTKQVRRDNARMVFEKYAGALNPMSLQPRRTRSVACGTTAKTRLRAASARRRTWGSKPLRKSSTETSGARVTSEPRSRRAGRGRHL